MASSDTHSSFLALPLEVREIIYRCVAAVSNSIDWYICLDIDSNVVNFAAVKLVLKMFEGLALACHQSNIESRPFLVPFTGIRYPHQFADEEHAAIKHKIPDNQLANITKFHVVEGFGGAPPSIYQRLTGLRVLSFFDGNNDVLNLSVKRHDLDTSTGTQAAIEQITRELRISPTVRGWGQEVLAHSGRKHAVEVSGIAFLLPDQTGSPGDLTMDYVIDMDRREFIKKKFW